MEGVNGGAPLNCGRCTEHHYDQACAAGVYEKALLASVLELKREPYVSQTASSHLIQAFGRIQIIGEPIIIPVPLSRRRKLERGFNQAVVLAKTVSRHSGLRVDEHSLARTTDTLMHRAAMDSKAREATVAKVFEVVRPGLVQERNILLVDDLLTSGATVSQCARVLKKSGAGKVMVLTLARAV
jgi:ComF family protein